MPRVLGPACVVAWLLTLGAPVLARAPRTVLFGGDVAGWVRQRPATIHITSDQNIRKIRWTNWGGSTATGAGTLVFSASDMVSPTPVQLTLSRVRRCGKRLRYLRLRIAPKNASVDVIDYTCRSPA
jgi:hypothetical protein